MIYYQVVTRFYDGGYVEVSEVKPIESDRMPESGSSEAAVCDIYYDYFDNEKEAEKHRREALREAGRK